MTATTHSVAIATTSQLAADAAGEIAELGGNAVDCGIAAAMCSINTQPGVCALAGSAFVTVWPEGEAPVTIDGNVTVPGKGLAAGATRKAEAVELDYGGGVTTLVGASSVAVPGALAALFEASRRYGRVPWQSLLMPTVRATRRGFPLAEACHYYLGYSGDKIFGRSEDGHAALHGEDGHLLPVGGRVVVPHLADSLEQIAREGEAAFYRGELGGCIVDHVRAGGGTLTAEDMAEYRAETREALIVDAGEWRIATNPPPAIGGANLGAMLLTFGTGKFVDWTPDRVLDLVRTQEAVIACRRETLDCEVDVTPAAREMLRLAGEGEMVARWCSGSTVHTSAADSGGTGCSITASSGYGAGEMAPQTGLWLNNCLGEIELNRQGLDAGPPGRRLPSNMAPSVARSPGTVLSFGSPGADRITTALHQFLVNFLQRGLDLDAAIGAPRLHLSFEKDGKRLATEPGITLPALDVPVAEFPGLNMYFGGVGAALARSDGEYRAAADPRREGGTYLGREMRCHQG